MPTLGPGSQIYLKRTIEDLQPVVRTSRPYPLEAADKTEIFLPTLVDGFSRRSPGMTEDISLSAPGLLEGYFSTVVIKYSAEKDETQLYTPSLIEGVFSSIVQRIPVHTDSTQVVVPQILEGAHSVVVIRYTMETESIQVALPVISEARHEQ